MTDLAISLSSMARDLNRVAVGLNCGSDKMAKRFYEEALKRKDEVPTSEIPGYVKNILTDLNPDNKLDQDFAEKALVHSILLENFVIKVLN